MKENRNNMKTICIHFDTENNYITVDEFIQTINTYEIVAKTFSENLFDVRNGIKVYILPPKNGGFIINVGFWITSLAASAILSCVISEEFKGFVKGITKNSKKFPNGYEMGSAGEIIGEMANGFIEQTSEEIYELEKYIPKNKNIDSAVKTKADFYNMCSRDIKIRGIGFSDKHDFPLKRSDFPSRAVAPTTKPLPVKEELKELIVVKPVNVDEDLQWDLKDYNTKESLTVKMHDENFKAMLLNGQCPQREHATPDIILARIEFHDNLKNGKESKLEHIITDVYKFNNKILKPTPKHLKLNRKYKIDNGQLNFLTKLDIKNEN